MAAIITLTELSLKVPIHDLFYSLAASVNNEYISFLDSSLLPSKYSRFSYLAWEPDFAIYGSSGSNIMACFKGSKSGGKLASTKKEGILKNGNIVEEGNPMAHLRKIFAEVLENKTEKYIIIQNGRNSGQG